MYLADCMRVIASGLEAEDMPGMTAFLYAQQRCKDVLANAELYAFTRSAMEMASDLIIDTPERLERVAEAVFRKRRRVFVEAGYQERAEMFSSMRGFPQVQRENNRFDPKRIGLDINCYGDGRARIGVYWNFPKISREKLGKSTSGKKRSRLALEALRESLSFGTGYTFLDVDLNKMSDLGRADFGTGLKVPNSTVSSFMAQAEDQLQRFVNAREDLSTPARRKRYLEMEAWRLYRLNSLATPEFDRQAIDTAIELCSGSGQRIEEFLEETRGDLDGEIIYAIGFLAALDAGGHSLSRSTRQGRPSRRAAPAAPGDLRVDELSVLSMDLSGGPRQRDGSPAFSGKGGGTGPRARHPVQGHLFLARNGVMTYRKAHWRGGGDNTRKILRRVI